jgi:hypothetical protein
VAVDILAVAGDDRFALPAQPGEAQQSGGDGPRALLDVDGDRFDTNACHVMFLDQPDPHEMTDGGQRLLAVRACRHLAFFARYRSERVEHDFLQQLAQGQPLKLGQSLEYLDHALVHAHAKLHALRALEICRAFGLSHGAQPYWYQGTIVTWYLPLQRDAQGLTAVSESRPGVAEPRGLRRVVRDDDLANHDFSVHNDERPPIDCRLR